MATVLNLEPITTLTRSQFYQLCQVNPNLLLEGSPQGELIIVPPVGGESGNQDANLIGEQIKVLSQISENGWKCMELHYEYHDS